jgi:hypothetical protein
MFIIAGAGAASLISSVWRLRKTRQLSRWLLVIATVILQTVLFVELFSAYIQWYPSIPVDSGNICSTGNRSPL